MSEQDWRYDLALIREALPSLVSVEANPVIVAKVREARRANDRLFHLLRSIEHVLKDSR